MKLTTVLLLITLLVACARNPNAETRAKQELRLMQAMQKKLYNDINNDSSKIKFHVLNVTFFEDKDLYECEFKVELKQLNHDTIGIMTADISKDLSKVLRKS